MPEPTRSDPPAPAEEEAGASPARPDATPPPGRIALVVDGVPVEVDDDSLTLLEALRERLDLTSVKDGCAPQGQCGCCTVLVDGAPRVACVTPLRRVRGRAITTVDGLSPEVRTAWAEAFAATGGSQCGFCTPGIICRLEGARRKGVAVDDHGAVERALAAHLCRCTGWRPIVDAWDTAVAALEGEVAVAVGTSESRTDRPPEAGRDLARAARRAEIEGGAPQRVGPEVALGRGGFADDVTPADALVALPDGAGGWVVGETLGEVRALSGKVQGRRTTVEARPPLDLPVGAWDATLRTTWVEPAYLEPDSAWCRPGGRPVGPLLNGGAFGAKRSSPVATAARALADRWGRPVRVLLAREDVVRVGPKRPPVAGGARADGTGVLRAVRTPGLVDTVAAVAPGLVVEEVDRPGPPTDLAIRGAGWVEALLLVGAAADASDPAVGSGPPATAEVVAPSGGWARAEIAGTDGAVRVRVRAGDPLDEVVLRSYCVGAAHQALSWVRSEGLAVTDGGTVEDLTIRSFGILKASEMPAVEVVVEPGGAGDPDEPVNGSDAVFAAVALAAWRAAGTPTDLPVG